MDAKTPPTVSLDTEEHKPPHLNWLSQWLPPESYITLAQVAERIGDRDIAAVLPMCECLGYTMHKSQVPIPSDAWTSPAWAWNVEENRCGPTRYGEHLQFQIAVYAADVDAFVEGRTPGEEPALILTVDDVEFEGLPGGWKMRTIKGIAWQSYKDTANSPVRVDAARAVGDAWSYDVSEAWS